MKKRAATSSPTKASAKNTSAKKSVRSSADEDNRTRSVGGGVSWFDPHMKTPATKSVIFHFAIIALCVIGIPYIAPEPPIQRDIVPVEIVTIADKTQTDKAPQRTEKPKAEEKPTENEKAPPKPVAPKVTSKEPPKPVPPKPPEDTKKEAETKPPEPIPAPSPKPKAKPKPPEKKKEKDDDKKKEVVKKQEDQFQGLLRNLMDSQPQNAQKSPDNAEIADKAAPVAPVAQQMTANEMAALKQQFSECWNLLAGARYAENLVVRVRMTVNPDRKVREAKIVDQMRYNRDPYFRAAADSVLRAIYSPHCTPLKLPPDKYELWNTIVINFDPREML